MVGRRGREAEAGFPKSLPDRTLGAGDPDADGESGDAEDGAEFAAGAAVDVGFKQQGAVGAGERAEDLLEEQGPGIGVDGGGAFGEQFHGAGVAEVQISQVACNREDPGLDGGDLFQLGAALPTARPGGLREFFGPLAIASAGTEVVHGLMEMVAVGRFKLAGADGGETIRHVSAKGWGCGEERAK